MTLTSLELRNFRNYQKSTWHFSPETTVILGANGSGKTNILEAINYLSTTKSFKARYDREAIKFDEAVADIFGETTENKLSLIISSPTPPTFPSPPTLTTTKKLYKINSTPKLASSFVGTLKTVLFRPEDIDILTDGPSLRRGFLDDVLTQTDPTYAKAHAVYHKILTQRNRILGDRDKPLQSKLNELAYWNQELLKNGQILQTSRQELINYLNNKLPQIVKNLFPLSPQSPLLTLIYRPSLMNEERLKSHVDAELASGLTLIGPQRDDFEVLQDAKNLTAYGSRGQQRTAVLALRLAQLSYIKEKCNEEPLLLLDDIFSELDEAHREAILNIVGEQQTILTATELPEELKNTLQKAKIINLA